ncbi:MAG TPA: sensor histidine kinase [Homoserinimonas sp.]|nr:sensor histidine kinase [Homoserinimonas sp.]
MWASAIDLLIDSVLATAWFTVIVTLIITGVATLPALGVGVILLLLASAVTRASGWVERHRAMALYEVTIAPPVRRRTKQTGGIRWIAQAFVDLIDPVTWRTILHHFLSMLLGSLMVALWAWGIRLMFITQDTGFAWLVGIGGAVVLLAYIYWAGRLDRRLSVALLGPSSNAVLLEKVDTLADARKGAVDAASIERQRIERDLHDGVQPQLVSVALTLGMARSKFDSDPDAAKALLEQAHTEAKASITELRQLARGIHPAVLTDRGLDAALSAVASRCLVPTTISVAVPGRAAPEAEAVIYFAVAEALTNVAKHSAASECAVTVVQEAAETEDCNLIARIRDNGVGGAHVGDGLGQGGLAGMRDRVRAAGGTMLIESPNGGPTLITVEVPCAS